MRSATFLAILTPALQAANDFAPVRAIFEKSCIRCHSGDSPRADPRILIRRLSFDLTGVLRLGYLGPGMRLTFPTEGRRVITSRIVALRAKPKN